MPTTTRTKTDTKKKKPRKRRVRETVHVRLPKKPILPVADLDAFSFMVFGEKKIGKTTLALQGDRPLLLNFDPPQLSYTRREIHCPDWRTFRAALKKLEAVDPFPYGRIILDGVGLWYNACQSWVCEQLMVDHPNDEPWGKGWAMLQNEFLSGVVRLLKLPVGVWFIAHSTEREVEDHDGNTHNRIVPALTARAEETLNGMVDGWFAYVWHGTARRLIVRGSERVGAGHRLDEEGSERFRTTGGKRIRHIPMGNNPKDAMRNFIAAFNNEQTRSAPKPERRRAR